MWAPRFSGLCLLMLCSMVTAQVSLTSLPLVQLGNVRESDNWYHFSNLKMNWHEAEQYCRQNYLHLASIETRAEFDAFERHLTTLGYTAAVWLSGSDLASEGKWYWHSTGEMFGSSKSPYYAWNAWEPNNAGNNEHCMTSVPSGDYWQWNDDNCFNKLSFVCELNPICWGYFDEGKPY